MSDDLVKALRAADRIRELENEIRRDAMQYLADVQRLEETIEDLTRRHKHALHKIDVLEDIIAEKKEKIDG